MGCCWSDKSKVAQNDSTLTTTTSGGASSSVPSERLSVRSEGEILQSSNLKNFDFNDLKTATRDFRPDTVVGEGGFGSVYKGWIDKETFEPVRPGSGLLIAVKRLNQEGFQGHREWLAEINYLGQLKHPNLVKLIGYCLEDEHHLLVYEFMPCGSLEDHLFKRSSYTEPLSWSLRMKIALGAAKGLAFLHSPKTKVIYRDFKSSNILLDSDYNAKLSDFGMARDGPLGEKSYVSTRVVGTHGYAAPEYIATGHLTAKSDIYSFGVVLLELMTGKRVLDLNRSSKEENLITWARPYLRKDRVHRIMDSRIQGQYSSRSAKILNDLVIQCLSVEPRFRPNMDEVVKILEPLQDVSKTIVFEPVKRGKKHSSSHNEELRKGPNHKTKHSVVNEVCKDRATKSPNLSPSCQEVCT